MRDRISTVSPRAGYSAAPGKGAGPKRVPAPVWNHEDLVHLDFSEYGRSPRFVSGWWILPGLFLGATLVVYLVLG